jgi:hypothetical protein
VTHPLRMQPFSIMAPSVQQREAKQPRRGGGGKQTKTTKYAASDSAGEQVHSPSGSLLGAIWARTSTNEAPSCWQHLASLLGSLAGTAITDNRALRFHLVKPTKCIANLSNSIGKRTTSDASTVDFLKDHTQLSGNT